MSIIFINVNEALGTELNKVQTPEEAADALHIPVIAEIEPRPDPIYGHTFKWPVQEVEQFVASQSPQ